MSRFNMATVSAAAVALLWPGIPAWADVTVNVPAPTGQPAPGNDYNVTVVYGAGQPLSPGELITFTSSSEIAGISLDRGARAENPYHTNNGNSNVDVKVDHPGIAKGIIRYKDGTRRAVLIFIGAKSVTVTDAHVRALSNGDLDVYYTVEWSDRNTGNGHWVADIPAWVLRPAQPPAPNPPGHSEGKGE